MEAKPAQQNIQDSFLNNARKERNNITIYLVSGVKLTGGSGRSTSTRCARNSNQEQLIFKHAISTVVITRGGHIHAEARPSRRMPRRRFQTRLPVPRDEVSWLAPE